MDFHDASRTFNTTKKGLVRCFEMEKPSLDEQQIEEIDILVSEAMALNKELKFKLFKEGVAEDLIGTVQYLNYEQHKLHVKDHHDQTVYITMNDIIGVAYND